METELFDLLRRCITEREANAPARLAEQEAELEKRKCTAPELGRWIDASGDFPFLIETLMLSDAVFSEEYPQVKLSEEERKSFAYALEAHCENCPHCGFRRASDLDWQFQVNTAFAENREAIGQVIARAVGKK
jgi:hypothetical protein